MSQTLQDNSWRISLAWKAACATVPFVVGYGMIAGMAPSTQRAVIMVVLGLGAYLLRREGDTLNLIAVAALLILVWHPPMLFTIGFQLSFAAVVVIVLGLQHIWPGLQRASHPAPKSARPRLLTFMAVTLYATAGTLPLLMYYFQQFSLIGLMANLVAVPLVGFAVLPLGLSALGLLAFSSTLATWCLQAGGVLLDILLAVTRWAEVSACRRNCPMRGVGTISPMPSASSSFWNAMPTTRSSWNTGPPLLPALIAASTVTARSLRCEWA